VQGVSNLVYSQFLGAQQVTFGVHGFLFEETVHGFGRVQEVAILRMFLVAGREYGTVPVGVEAVDNAQRGSLDRCELRGGDSLLENRVPLLIELFSQSLHRSIVPIPRCRYMT
jgi:hypothetical protein